jgi:methyl-accepting chemotaxis protein
MNQQTTFLSRIGSFFGRKTNRIADNGDVSMEIGAPPQQLIEPRSTFLRPWARRDAAISHLQEGFNTLTDLMSGIKENLDKQSERHAELMNYLSHLPQLAQELPEANRVHGETLKAIQQQIEGQSAQHDRLSEILNRMNEAGAEQTTKIHELRERVESFREKDEAIAENLSSVGEAMQNVSYNSSTSAKILEQLRDNTDSRDGQLERILHKQNVRFTTMLAIAIFLSVAALVAVSVTGYLLILKK